MNENYVTETYTDESETMTWKNWLAILAIVFPYLIGAGACVYYATLWCGMAAEKISEWVEAKRMAFDALRDQWTIRLHRFDQMIGLSESEEE